MLMKYNHTIYKYNHDTNSLLVIIMISAITYICDNNTDISNNTGGA